MGIYLSMLMIAVYYNMHSYVEPASDPRTWNLPSVTN